MDDDSPDDVAHRMFAAQLFADHPLGRETAGDRDTVQAIDAADVRRFFESHYHAGSMVVTLAGPIEHDDAAEVGRRLRSPTSVQRVRCRLATHPTRSAGTTRSTTTPSRCTS